MKFLMFTVLVLGLGSMGCWLVATEHYGWAWIPFVGMLGASFNERE